MTLATRPGSGDFARDRAHAPASPAPASPTPDRPQRIHALQVLAVTLLYIVASGAILTWTLRASHVETIAAARSMLDAFTTVSEEQTGQAIASVEDTLEAADILLARTGVDAVDTDPVAKVELRRLALNRPLVRWLRVVRADGRVAFASHGHTDLAAEVDRSLIEMFQAHPERRIAFVMPREMPLAWGLELALAQPWHHPDGRLAGVIMAALDRAHFEHGWTAGSGTSGTSVSMFSRDGVMLIRSPPQDWAIGRSFANRLLFRDLLPVNAQGSYRHTSILDGEDRLLSYRTLNAYPTLVIAVSRRTEDVLAPWTRTFWLVVASWLVTSGAGAAMIFFLTRRVGADARRLEVVRQVNQQLVETSVDLILVVTRTGDIVEVSPSIQTILGYQPSELVGRSGGAYVVEEDLEKVRTEMRQARHGHVVRNFECRYRHKDGRIVMLAWTGRWSEAAQLHFFIGRDMTQQHAMEETLRQAQKMEVVGQLTGGVAHDFNNLLTIVLGSAELLAAQVRAQPAASKLAEMIVSAAMRGAALTRSLLAFSRKQKLEPQATDANKLLEGMGPLLRRALGEQVRVEIQCGAGLPTINIDPSQLETALLNLAVNARDAMPNGGRLTLSTETAEIDDDYVRLNPGASAGSYLMIAVADTGTGMAPGVLAQAFEPFFTTKEVGKGSGLGLSMVYGFVKQSNGHISIYSEEGLGTVVRLYLPSTSTPAVAADAEAPAEAPKAAGETILVTEDDEGVRTHVLGLLRTLGYETLAAGDATAALSILRRGTPVDLLFTDIVMPGGMNGAELARQAQLLRPGLKVLYTSGYTGDALSHHGSLGVNVELLIKPYRRQALAAQLRKVLDAA